MMPSQASLSMCFEKVVILFLDVWSPPDLVLAKLRREPVDVFIFPKSMMRTAVAVDVACHEREHDVFPQLGTHMRYYPFR
jgi:hypothetical protein